MICLGFKPNIGLALFLRKLDIGIITTKDRKRMICLVLFFFCMNLCV